MSNSPAEVAALRLPNTIVGGSTGWAVYVGKMPPVPDAVVVFYDTGGRSPNPKWAVDYPSIQAMIRGLPNDYGPTWTKAREVRDYLLGLDSVTIGSDRWVSITCPGDVGFIGYDDTMRPSLSINFALIIEPSSVGNREAL